MSLVEMSLAGSLIILAAVLIRALARDRLPVGAFSALWALACARLLVPVRLPFRFSAWTLLRAPATVLPPADTSAAVLPAAAEKVVDITQFAKAVPATAGPSLSPWTAVWAVGAALLAAAFTLSYIRAYRRFRTAQTAAWPQRPLPHGAAVCWSDAVAAPLTYGVLRPVILLPWSMSGADAGTLGFVLAHELAHVRRFDAARKLVLAGVLCLHWFNPLVWAMFALADRDMERACDRAVIDAFGPDARRGYARSLLDMEERRSGFAPSSGFAKNAIEERIHSVMKMQKRSFLSAVLAAALVLSVGAAFATAAPEDPTPESTPTALSKDVILSGDGSVMYVFTADGEPVSMSQQEYKMLFPSAEVEWWTAEEYAAWLEQEKKDLQDCLGQRAWTNSDGWFTWTQEKIDETIEMYEQVLEKIKSGLLVSKTVDGRTDAILAEDTDIAVQFSSGVDMVSPSDLYRGYSYTFNDGDDSTTLGPYDTPEALLAALKDEVDARVADGRLTQSEALGILAGYDPAPGTEQIFTSGGAVTYSFNGGESTALPEEEQTALELLQKRKAVADALNTAVDEELYSIERVQTDELRQSLDALDSALEPYRPFGLRYGYDVPTGELSLWWNGREVRGLYDGTAVVWITGHSGAGTWPAGTPELIAVYTDGTLTGLRLATEEEQAHWDWLREVSGISVAPDRSVPAAEPETEDSARTSSPDQFPEEAPQPVQENDGTVTVPPNESTVAFFGQAEGPYGDLGSGGRIRVTGDVNAAKGNTVSVGIQTRTDASLTVSLHGDTTVMGKSVDLKAGQMQTVTFCPEQDDTFAIYLTNNSEYSVEFSVSWAVGC